MGYLSSIPNTQARNTGFLTGVRIEENGMRRKVMRHQDCLISEREHLLADRLRLRPGFVASLIELLPRSTTTMAKFSL